MKNYEKLKSQLAMMESDTQKFFNGNNAAGTRVRKALQEIKKTCNDMRTEVQEIREKNK